VGHPAEQIIHKAETMQASLIVMGKRSHPPPSTVACTSAPPPRGEYPC
jgi:nucleotide-binding universal stress UspA family protein